MMLRSTVIAVLLVVCACAGCRKAADKAVERAIESQMAKDGTEGDVQVSDKSISFKLKGEKGESTVALGANVKLPANYPTDVPLYAKQTLTMAQAHEENEVFLLQATSADTMDQIAEFYQQESPKQGWKEDSSMELGDTRILMYKKDGRTLQVMLGAGDDGTMVTVNTGKSN